ncbi:hypothetical protein KG090_04940 [Carnobacteriaceae bacterium zg-ZUI240]|nr:hypothetical protein [Carnobacteriaceae bacterium zg-ZUI240]
MTSIILLVNPNSGGHRSQKIVATIQNELDQQQLTYDTLTSTSLAHLRELTLQIAQAYTPQQKVIVIGGDGTIHHVVQTLVAHHYRIPLGFIPSGTGNDFASKVLRHREPLSQLHDILRCETPFILPILQSNQAIAINSFGIGFDAQVCHLVEHSKVKPLFNRLKIGFLSYLLLVIRALFQFKTFDLTVDGTTYPKVAMATFLNNPQFGGGLVLDPSLSIFDETAHAIIIHSLSLPKLISLLIKFARHTHLSHECVLKIPFTKMSIQFEPNIFTQADGEVNELVGTSQHIQLINYPFWFKALNK